ncbi:hypothetical protein [Pararhodobacter marinus]|uniref:hypothetical protein n=1 Tax=Pararhodobacter marinus TaxID=2184063 RepID=UPI0035127380
MTIVKLLNQYLEAVEIGTQRTVTEQKPTIPEEDDAGPVGHAVRKALQTIGRVPSSPYRDTLVEQAKEDIHRVARAIVAAERHTER